ncbi:hypothetical protein SAMN05216236_1595 [Sedimentitalea nanhaiensis]|uniref:Uncharacterized protein n=1 Tax=Sedimentitalea nanhaiensis TaxID=999627 RepID=A0A1I7EBB4_9RHOB|nr:hypothetical protein SAMN05216236_1595 [Sedimentitalea nanhaiensis]
MEDEGKAAELLEESGHETLTYCKRRLRPTGVQLDGLKFQGSNSSIRFAGCPAAIASSVALR